MSNAQNDHYFETTKEAFQEHEAVEEARKEKLERLEVDIKQDLFDLFALVRESEKKLINK